MAKRRTINMVKSQVIYKDYSKDAERTVLVSGENLAHMFGKIARWYTDISWVGHTHTEANITDFGTYAGASTKGGAATSANKLNIGSADIGSETKPVYFSYLTGKPVACTYSLNASVPANAVFTDINVKQSPSTADESREVLFAGNTGNTETTGTVGKSNKLYFNPNTGALTATSFSGSLAASNLTGTIDAGRLPTTAVTAGSYGPAAGGTLTYGGTFDVPYVTVDKYGRLTAGSTKTFTMPAQYTHPSTSGNKHIPSGGSSGQYLKWSSDGTAIWSAIAAADLPAHTHSEYLPLAGGTMTGDLAFNTVTSTTYPAASNQISFGGSTDGGQIFFEVQASDAGALVIQTTDDPNAKIVFRNKVTSGGTRANEVTITDGVISGNGSGLTNIVSAGKWTTARTITIGSTGKSVDGSGNVSWTLAEIGAAASNHTHSYLPLSGGTMTGVISSTVTTSTHIAGNKGTAIINSTAGAGYNMLAKMKSSNGVFTIGTYNDKFSLYYTTDTIISAGTNTTTYDILLLNEAGNTQLGKNLYFPQKADGIYYAGTKATSRLVRFVDNTGDAYGNGIGIGGGGVVCIGAGEASDALIDASIFTPGSETLYLASDETIILYSNCQTIGNRVGIVYDSSGRLRPDTNNTRMLGGSDYYWNAAYITQTIGGYRGSWISARTNATIKNISVDRDSYTPVISCKSTSGEWSMGTLGTNEYLYISYTTDANYSAGSNRANTWYFNSDGWYSGTASKADKWTTARTITIGSTGKSVDGSGNVSWSLSEIGAAAASHSHNYIGAISDGSYWGMGSPSLDGSAWIRTTSNGLIPYQSGGRTSSHSSLGTSSWYFSNAYINSIYADSIGFNGTKATTQMIKFLDNTSDGNGNGILIGGGGVVCVGAGESASALNSASVFSPGTEQLYLAADGNINLLTNCDTVANRIVTTIDTAGRILAKNQIITSNADGFRICKNGIGSFMRNDGDNTYFLLTDKKTDGSESTAGWNSLRPIYWSNTTGWCTIYGSTTRADYPTGFDSRSGSQTWGVQTGTFVTAWNATNSSCLAFRRDCPSSGKLSAIIDGYFYQNEGQYMCLDTSNYVDYAARADYVDSYLSANRFAFAKAAGITVYYSRDGGSSLNNYSLTDDQKIGLFTTDVNIKLGAYSSDYATAQYQTLVVIDASSAGLYSQINEFTIQISTSGSNGCKVYIEAMQVGSNVWSKIKDWTGLQGWSGTNRIRINAITFGTGSGHYQKIRFTFGCTGGATSGNYHGMEILHIHAFGGEGWAVQSSLGLTGHMYTWDTSKNVTFPAQLSCNIGTINTIASRTAKVLSGVSHSGWTDNAHDDAIAPTMSFIAFWNGAYNSSGNSNLAYCNKGAFGTIITKASGDYIPISGSTNITGNLRVSMGNTSGPVISVYNGTYEIGLHVGTGGINHGIYDFTSNINTWMCYHNGTEFLFNGKANTAGKWATARTLTLTGSVTGSASIDGSGNVSLATTTNHTHSYLPLAGGTMTGDLNFTGVTSTSYPAKSNQIYFPGSTDWAKIYYRVDASDAGRLVFDIGDDTNTRIDFAYNGTTKSYIDTSGNFSGASYRANYLDIVAGNEIRFSVDSKPANAIDLYLGYAWSGGTKDAKINRYVFMNGNATLTNVKAALFEGKSTSSAYTNYDAAVNIQTGSSAQAKISLQTLINWLINTKKVLPASTLVHKIIQTGWSYAGNDFLQISCNGRNYEIQLAGVVLEFIGFVVSYNSGEFRLFIHTSPTTSGSASSGYVLAPPSTTFVYTCNGSGYSPTWKMISNFGKYANDFWGLTDPNGNDNNWIRTTSNGIIPYQSGSLGSGHQSLGNSSWYFSYIYADQHAGYRLGLGSSSIQGRIDIQSPTTASVAYNSTNPRIRFMNAGADQNIDIVMCDFDSVRGPAALSVHGNQGGEYLLAPNISAWDYTNNKLMAMLSAWSLGTTSAVGQGRVIAGNGTKKGTAGNARGLVEIYSEQDGAAFIIAPPSLTTDVTLTLPSTSGTLALVTELYKILWSGSTSCTARSSTSITLTTAISANKYRFIKVVWNCGSYTGTSEFRADTLNVTNNIPSSSDATTMNIIQFKIASDGKSVSVGPGTTTITVIQIAGVYPI